MIETMLFRGTFVQFPSLGTLEIFRDHLLVVDDALGIITHFDAATSQTSQTILDQTKDPSRIKRIPDGDFIMPAFCDLHLHAPQFLYQGTGLHLPLMKWLDEYAFKAEERLDADPELAKRVYERLARRLAENGTGTVLLFGTIKEETNLILADAMQKEGIRAFVGKLSMDMSSRPTYVEPSAESSLRSASSFIARFRQRVAHLPPHRRLVEPVITPRFVPTCSDALLRGLARLAQSESTVIQSHMAEAHDEVEWVEKDRGVSDVEVFNRNGLLTRRTVQAHCTFLSAAQLDLVASTRTAIAHCPLSNAYFSARPFRLREALRRGVRVGLGTDVAGGYSVDVMNAMRQAVITSRMREGSSTVEEAAAGAEKDESLAVDWVDALFLATKGGAEALGLESGTFDVGLSFDAQQISLIDTRSDSGVGPLDFFDSETKEVCVDREMLEKWWCVGDHRNRVGLWVQGSSCR